MFQWQTEILWAEPRESTETEYWESLQLPGETNCDKIEISQH